MNNKVSTTGKMTASKFFKLSPSEQWVVFDKVLKQANIDQKNIIFEHQKNLC